MRPCANDHPPTPAICRLCWLFLDPGPLGKSYRALWRGEAGRPSDGQRIGSGVPPPRAEGCATQDGTIRRHRLDTACCGSKVFDVFRCGHEGYGPETTLADCAAMCGLRPEEPVNKLSARPPGRGRPFPRRPAPPAEPARGAAACRPRRPTSGRRAPEDLTADTPVPAVARLLDGPTAELPEGWAGWENVRLAHVRLLERAIARCRPCPSGLYRGRGIVTCVSASPGGVPARTSPTATSPALGPGRRVAPPGLHPPRHLRPPRAARVGPPS